MPLTQRSRSALYHGLAEIIDDEQAVEEMLSYFPSRDVEEPVTKEFLRAELAQLRSELHVGFRNLAGTMVAVAGVIVAAVALLG